MKKSILVLALFFSMSVLITSCKDSKKETETEQTETKQTETEQTEIEQTEIEQTETEQTEQGVEKADIAMNDAYKCPMDCEKGKTYDKEGKCPVCKMDLKKVEEEGEHEHENGDKDENHDADAN